MSDEICVEGSSFKLVGGFYDGMILVLAQVGAGFYKLFAMEGGKLDLNRWTDHSFSYGDTLSSVADWIEATHDAEGVLINPADCR